LGAFLVQEGSPISFTANLRAINGDILTGSIAIFWNQPGLKSFLEWDPQVLDIVAGLTHRRVSSNFAGVDALPSSSCRMVLACVYRR
jgi:hypothetical protein